MIKIYTPFVNIKVLKTIVPVVLSMFFRPVSKLFQDYRNFSQNCFYSPQRTVNRKITAHYFVSIINTSLLLCTNFVISSGESCLWLSIARS